MSSDELGVFWRSLVAIRPESSAWLDGSKPGPNRVLCLAFSLWHGVRREFHRATLLPVEHDLRDADGRLTESLTGLPDSLLDIGPEDVTEIDLPPLEADAGL